MKSIFVFLMTCIFASPVFSQVIQAGKSVTITIAGVPNEEMARFSPGKFPVSEAGTVNMPFIGQVRAAGLRSDQLAASLQNAYRSAEIYTNPTFQVISDSENAEFNQLTVYVGGQVRKTGPIPFNRGLTLYQAITAAGGPTEFGSVRRVRVHRGPNSQVYDITKSQFMNVRLEAGDTIDVPQKDWIGR